MEANEMRQDIVDRGIEKGENQMRPVLESLSADRTDRSDMADPLAGRVGSNSAGSDPTGATPFAKSTGADLPERAGIGRKEQEIHERQADPEAVRESEKEAELDTTSEPEPGEGKPAA